MAGLSYTAYVLCHTIGKEYVHYKGEKHHVNNLILSWLVATLFQSIMKNPSLLTGSNIRNTRREVYKREGGCIACDTLLKNNM